jgi:hypothetical protein
MPGPLPAGQALVHYVAELERQREARGLAWWWYFAPLFAGIGYNTIAFGIFARRPFPAVIGIAACLALAMLIVRAAARRRQRLADKIAQLERSAGDQPA